MSSSCPAKMGSHWRVVYLPMAPAVQHLNIASSPSLRRSKRYIAWRLRARDFLAALCCGLLEDSPRATSCNIRESMSVFSRSRTPGTTFSTRSPRMYHTPASACKGSALGALASPEPPTERASSGPLGQREQAVPATRSCCAQARARNATLRRVFIFAPMHLRFGYLASSARNRWVYPVSHDHKWVCWGIFVPSAA